MENSNSQDAQALTKQVLQAIENQDWNAARALLSDDFKFSGAVPVPIGPDEWLGIHRALAAAMSDFAFHYQATGGSGNQAKGTVQVGGTHDGTFSVPIPGIPTITATGKKILNPVEHVAVTVQDGKVTDYVVEHLATGGVVGLVSQMGGTIPAH